MARGSQLIPSEDGIHKKRDAEMTVARSVNAVKTLVAQWIVVQENMRSMIHSRMRFGRFLSPCRLDVMRNQSSARGLDACVNGWRRTTYVRTIIERETQPKNTPEKATQSHSGVI